MLTTPRYPEKSTIEIFQHGRWVPAADIRAVDTATCRVEYWADYIFGTHSQAIVLNLPVGYQPPRMVDRGMGPVDDFTPPSFLVDLVPQGKGRAFLCNALGLADADGVAMPLLMAGAFNPIGNLRITSAVDFFTLQAQKAASAPLGAQRRLPGPTLGARHGGRRHHRRAGPMVCRYGTARRPGTRPLAAETATRQERCRPGGAAKRSRLPACGRGLRVHGEPMRVDEMLLVPRFDRLVDGAGLRRVVHDPLAETIEFLKRGVLNLALRNTDNHARNTAVQTLPGGRVQLTPVFDFAPMFMDPEVVLRGCHWVEPGVLAACAQTITTQAAQLHGLT